MSSKFSLLLHCNLEAELSVEQLKNSYAEQLGHFMDMGQRPHITVAMFRSSEENYSKWDKTLCSVAAAEAFELCFNRVVQFSNRALVLLADDESNIILKSVFKKISAAAPTPLYNKAQRPHITIGRKLSIEQLAASKQLDLAAPLYVMCTGISVYKFNEKSHRYDGFSVYDFK